MPAVRPNTETVLARYDIVAEGPIPTAPLKHVGLSLLDNNAVQPGGEVTSVEMAPPLRRNNTCTLDAHGSAELTADEVKQIAVFIDEVEAEYEAQRVRDPVQYHIYPHVLERTKNGVTVYRRFSCAGFAIEAYAGAGVTLIDNSQAWPDVTLETLLYAYPEFEESLKDTRLRAKYGLDGDGPWPVLLVGYVLHSLDRTRAAILDSPYSPREGDECFP